MLKAIKIFTDGSCSAQKKLTGALRGGVGIYSCTPAIDKGIFREITIGNVTGYSYKLSGYPKITNNIAELTAIKLSLLIYKPYKFKENEYHIYTDSMYSLKACTEWYKKWQDNNWKTASGTLVLNSDLIKDIVYLLSLSDNVTFFHVRSHTKNNGLSGEELELWEGNNNADILATSAWDFALPVPKEEPVVVLSVK